MRQHPGRWLAVVALLLQAANALGAGQHFGIAVRDITPLPATLAANDIYLGGYGLWKSRGPADDIHDPLMAQAACLTEADEGFCIVVVDSLGLPGPIAARVAQVASDIIGLPAERLLVAATHTHAAPDLLGLWGGAPGTYVELLIAQSAAAIVEAFESRQPASLHYAVGKGVAHNRRGWGHTDDDLVVIHALAAETGRLLGSLINFAAHPVIAPAENRAISSDFVHYLRERYQQASGAPVVYVNGALGDVVPGPRSDGYWAEAERYGAGLADAAMATRPLAKQIAPGIVMRRQALKLPLENWRLRLAHAIGVLDDDIDGSPWRRSVTTSVAYIRLGHVAPGDSAPGQTSLGQTARGDVRPVAAVEIVALPGEAVTGLGLAIKAGLAAPARLVLGQTGGSLGYFVRADEWHTGRNRNYEESVSLGRQAGERVLAAVTAVVDEAPLAAD